MVACLLTNRKTESVYKKWFGNLKKEGLELKTGMTDLEFGIANAGY
jgi:hypothetical protein